MVTWRSQEPLRFIAAIWLLLGLSYIPWTVAVARSAIRGETFTVGTWTIVTPFLIVGLAPAGAIMVFRNRRRAGAVLLTALAINTLLSRGVVGTILSVIEGHPFTVLMVLLSAISLPVAGRVVLAAGVPVPGDNKAAKARV